MDSLLSGCCWEVWRRFLCKGCSSSSLSLDTAVAFEVDCNVKCRVLGDCGVGKSGNCCKFGEEESALGKGRKEGVVEGVDIDEDEIDDGIGGRDGGGGMDEAVDDFDGLRTFQGKTLSSVESLLLVLGVNDMSCTAI